MENQEFQEHILSRVQKLEEKQFGATFEENYTPREHAERISNGETENHFIGERTRESALQRVKSFEQNYDQGSVNSLHGAELQQYKREHAICEMLIKKYNITEDEVKA